MYLTRLPCRAGRSATDMPRQARPFRNHPRLWRPKSTATAAHRTTERASSPSDPLEALPAALSRLPGKPVQIVWWQPSYIAVPSRLPPTRTTHMPGPSDSHKTRSSTDSSSRERRSMPPRPLRPQTCPGVRTIKHDQAIIIITATTTDGRTSLHQRRAAATAFLPGHPGRWPT